MLTANKAQTATVQATDDASSTLASVPPRNVAKPFSKQHQNDSSKKQQTDWRSTSLDRGACLSDEPVQWHLSQLAPGEFSIWVNGHYLTAHEQHVVALGLLVLPWVREIHIYICMCMDAYCVQNIET